MNLSLVRDLFDCEKEPFHRQTDRPFFYLSGVASIILYGVVWRYFIIQPYENFIFRGVLIAVVAVAYTLRYTPSAPRAVRNFIFYFLLFCIPYFVFTMYAKNGASNFVWAATSVCSTYMVFGSLRWRTALIIFLLSLVSTEITARIFWNIDLYGVSVSHLEFIGIILFALTTAYDMASRRDNLEKAQTEGARKAISVLAHEVRSPLFALVAGLFAVERHLEDIDPGGSDIELLGRLRRRVRDIHDGLNFYLLNIHLSQDDLLVSECVQIDSIVQDVLETVRPAAGEVNIVADVDGGAVLGSSAGVRQVLVNLVRNAVNACEAAGHGAVSIRCKLVNDIYAISVEDTAATLKQADAERIFEAFVSLKGNGMGIGLHVSRVICHKMESRLEVKIQESVSTTFEFLLPKYFV